MARMKNVDRSRPIYCRHYATSGINLDLSLRCIRFSSNINRLACATCGKKKEAVLDSDFRWACLLCGMIFCGIEEEFYPDGHIRIHARFNDHPLSIRLDLPTEILCYTCYLPVVGERLAREKKNREERRKKLQERRQKQKVITDSASEGKTGRRVKGIPNLGNTCFFNSILQNLFVMDSLRQRLLALDEPRDLVTAELKTLFIKTLDDSTDTLHPNTLLYFVRYHSQKFEAGTEHDSHEFFIYLLGVLQLEGKVGVNEIFGGELSSILQCARCGNTSTTYEQFLDLSLQVPSECKKTHYSDTPLVAFLKSGKRRASFKDRARAKAAKKDPGEFTSTSDIDPGFGTCSGDAFDDDEVCEVDDTSGLVSLRRCLELFTEPEDLPEGRCEHCSGKIQYKSGDKKAWDSPMTDRKKNEVPGSSQQIGRLRKRFLVRRGPPILAIHLKRFKHEGLGSFFKIEGHSIFEETLDLTPYMDRSSMGDDEKCTYRLIGVVEHLGRSLHTGHYVAYVRQGDDRWFKASDLVVEEVSLQQVLQRDAYILFFERK